MLLLTVTADEKKAEKKAEKKVEAEKSVEPEAADSKKQEKRGLYEFGGHDFSDGGFGGYGGHDFGGQLSYGGDHGHHAHHEKTVTIVKNVPVPYEVVKHVPYAVEKKVPVPYKVS